MAFTVIQRSARHREEQPVICAYALIRNESVSCEAWPEVFDARWHVIAGQIGPWSVVKAAATERGRKAEALQRALEQSFRLMVDSLPISGILCTPDGEVHHANRHALAHAGVTLTELRSWRTDDLIHPSDREAFLALFEAVVKNGRIR